MTISRYLDFFHDGCVMNIQHFGSTVELSMSSAEMDADDIKDDIALSRDDSIQGILHIEGVTKILMDEAPFTGTLKKKHDHAGIFDFILSNNRVELQIVWDNFPPNPMTNDFTVIQIEAEKIWWENIPDLEEQFE